MEITEAIQRGIVAFTYVKVGGEVREALGTMLPEFLPEKHQQKAIDSNRTVPKGNMLYFDIESDGFRSCRLDNVLDWATVEPETDFKKYLTNR